MVKHLSMRVTLVALLLAMTLGANAREQKKQNKGVPAAEAQSTPPPAQAPAPEDYRIGTQDVLAINVWKEPDLSVAVPVRPDGKISLPLLNDVQAAGLTAMQLSAD